MRKLNWLEGKWISSGNEEKYNEINEGKGGTPLENGKMEDS